VNLESFKILVEENHEYCIPVLFDINGAEALTRFAVLKQASTFNLKTTKGTVLSFNRVIAGLPCGRKFHTENASCFVLGHFARYSEWFSRQRTIPLR